jgi:hypothetical protein
MCLLSGMVKRVRGVSYSMKVSPQNTNRMVSYWGVLHGTVVGALPHQQYYSSSYHASGCH